MSAASPNVVLTDDREARRLDVHKKTRLCKFFAVGACTRGSSCAFAHGSEQLRDQPDFSKTRLCADFVELGRCTAGQACRFAHSKSELRPGSAAKVGRPSKPATATPVTATSAAKQSEKSHVEAAAQVLQTLRAQHALHEQAALKLMLQSACARAPAPAPVKPVKATVRQEKDVECCFDNSGNFSRQTTWEGMETASAGFSRDSSTASASENVVAPEPSSGLELRVKNTFLEIQDEPEREVSEMRKVRSLPLLPGVA